jgi:predicted Zn-dependent protease
MGAGRDAIEFAQRHQEANPQDPEVALWLIDLSRRFQSDTGRAVGLQALSAIPSAQGNFLAQRALERAARAGPAAGIGLVEASSFEGQPGEIHVVRALAILEAEAERPTAAVERVEAWLDRDGESVASLLLLAEVLEQVSAALPDRRAALARAARLDPGDPGVLLNRGRLAAEAGDAGAALESFDAIPEDASDYAAGRLESALVLLAAAAPERALAMPQIQTRLEAALRHDARNARAALELARILAESDALSDRALELARRATLLGGGAPSAGLVGRLWAERGDVRLAIDSLERVTLAFPDDAYSYYWLARAREGYGDRMGAREAYERALELGGLSEPPRVYAEQGRARLVEVPDA